jgi:hypothetical protein
MGWRSGVKDALVWDGWRAAGWGLRLICAEFPELEDPDEGGGEGRDAAGLERTLGWVAVSWLFVGRDGRDEGGFE